jgi:hypothetical protein
MQKFKTGIQMKVWKIINPLLYKENGFAMLDFQGSRSDYKHSVIFHNVTESGNIKVSEVIGHAEGGIPNKFRKRIAQLNYSTITQPNYTSDADYMYWWIEDGTGSVILRVK